MSKEASKNEMDMEVINSKAVVERSRNYKQTEVGWIPEDWEVKKLGQLAKVAGGGTPKTTISKYWNGNINWFTPTEVGYHKYLIKSKSKITLEGFQNSSAQIHPKGTILLTSRAGIGDLGILTEEASTNQGFQSLIVNQECDNEYMYYLLTTLKPILLSRASGSTFLEISPSKVKEVTTSIPPTLTEQRAIATALSDVDTMLTSLEQLISKKQAIKQGAMQELLTPPHKGGKRLPGFSGEWEEKKLGESVSYKNGAAHEGSVVENGKYVIVNSKFISSEGNVVKYSNKNLCPVNSGEVLMVLSDVPNGKAIAKCYFVEKNNTFTLNQRICSLISDEINPKFLYLILNRNPYFLKFDDGVKQTNLKNDDILSCPIIIPEIEEQKAIAQVLSDMDEEIKALEEKKVKYQKIKGGMMQELLTGKIRMV